MGKRKLKNKRHQVHRARSGQKKKKRYTSIAANTFIKKSRLGKQDRIVSIKDSKTGIGVVLQRLLEYSDLFSGEKIDVHEEIRNFSRGTILEYALVLERDYAPYKLSDLLTKPFFDNDSDLHHDRLNRISSFLQRSGYTPDMTFYASERTILELLKLSFNVSEDNCRNKYDEITRRIMLFDLLLAINEQKITVYNPSKNSPPRLAQMMYAGLYAANEFSNYDGKLILAEQMYYAQIFFEFITTRNEYQIVYQRFLSIYGIENWTDYYKSVALLATQSIQFGPGTFNLERNDPDGLINKNVLSQISISEHETIDYEGSTDRNRDFVRFRSCPIIEMSSGDYVLFNQKLIIERLYNGIYFDLLPYQNELKYNGKTYTQFFKEVFVEKYLFDKTMLTCINEDHFDTCFPSSSAIEQKDYVDQKEEVDQPDFYIREGDAIFIFECKAVKLNGDLKSTVDNDAIIDELKNKLLQKRWKISKGEKRDLTTPKPEGVGQLVNHISKLEANTFKWERSRPDDAVYYPVLVLESNELMQLSLSALLNEWYDELLNTNHTIRKNRCQPIVVMTIKTLFLYNDLFYEKGFKNFFDGFLSDCRNHRDGKISMNVLDNFDDWMSRNNHSNKHSYFVKILEMLQSL